MTDIEICEKIIAKGDCSARKANIRCSDCPLVNGEFNCEKFGSIISESSPRAAKAYLKKHKGENNMWTCPKCNNTYNICVEKCPNDGYSQGDVTKERIKEKLEKIVLLGVTEEFNSISDVRTLTITYKC